MKTEVTGSSLKSGTHTRLTPNCTVCGAANGHWAETRSRVSLHFFGWCSISCIGFGLTGLSSWVAGNGLDLDLSGAVPVGPFLNGLIFS